MKIRDTQYVFFILFLLLAGAFSPAFAQKISGQFRVGYSLHSLSALKSFEEHILNTYKQLGIKPEKFDSFPPYWEFQARLLYHINKAHAVGILWDYTSTGSRIHYRDYSGEIRTDQLLGRRTLGLHMEGKTNPQGKWSFIIFAQFSYRRSVLEIEESIRVFEQESAYAAEFEAWGIGITPGVAGQFQIAPLLIRIELGFDYLYVNQPFHLKDNKDAILRNPDGGKVRAEWNGIRPGVTMGIVL